jgi:hypothetical protein
LFPLFLSSNSLSLFFRPDTVALEYTLVVVPYWHSTSLSPLASCVPGSPFLEVNS